MALVGLSRRRDSSGSLLLGLYIAGLCWSVLMVSRSAAHLIEVQNLFTGIDVAVSESQAKVTAVVLTAIATIAFLLWRRWLLLAQSPAAAELSGLRPAAWDALLLVLLAITLILSTSVSGTVMVVTMLFLPAAAVLPWVRRIPIAMIAAVALGLILLAVGFTVSVERDWPLSYSVGGTGAIALGVSHTLSRRFWSRSG
jgi:ABC-type Mn2+/Zn2+ transport system permease subunit